MYAFVANYLKLGSAADKHTNRQNPFFKGGDVKQTHKRTMELILSIIATTQPITQNNLKQLLLGWSYNR